MLKKKIFKDFLKDIPTKNLPPAFSPPNPGVYDLNKLVSTLSGQSEDAFLAKWYLRKIFLKI